MNEPASPRAPRVFDVPATEPAERATPGPAKSDDPRAPRALDLASVRIEDDALVALEDSAPTVEPARGFNWWGLAATCFVGLLGLAFSLWIEGLIGRLFVAAPWAGAVGLALLVGLGVALLALIGRELVAWRKLSKRTDLAERAARALSARDDRAATVIALDLAKMFEARPGTASGRRAILDADDVIMDARDRLYHAETALLGQLDEQALALAVGSARRVSVVTAVAPRALIDIAYVLLENTRLVRAVATTYGLRPGRLGFLRLLRDVLSHLAVTGAVSVGDGILEQALGHGVASRVSARLGEGVLNGLLTARVGAAAIDLCRPLPFRARPRPTARDVMRAVAALRSSRER